MVETLGLIASRLGLPAPDLLATVFSRWEELVGADVAAHATPTSVRGGALVVTVDHPAWGSSLRLLGGDLLRRLEEETGSSEVTELVVRVAPPGRRQGGQTPG